MAVGKCDSLPVPRDGCASTRASPPARRSSGWTDRNEQRDTEDTEDEHRGHRGRRENGTTGPDGHENENENENGNGNGNGETTVEQVSRHEHGRCDERREASRSPERPR